VQYEKKGIGQDIFFGIYQALQFLSQILHHFRDDIGGPALDGLFAL
jgi:hypothetical protein